MKPPLILLSDLWGNEKSDWLNYYQELLEPVFDLKYYDCCELGKIDKKSLNEEIIHSQFINGGIERASEKLLELEKDKVDIIAFSIGGTIAWKAGLKGLKINNLYAISSTRLRYETNKPNCTIKLHFGGKDLFKPDSTWFKNMKVPYEIKENGEHQIYREKEFSRKVCDEIITHYNT
ncbi:alpha/beta hydrolase [Marinilabiliaceae bacterium JC017]|nr:alpha/beta hydrolase [Marinilabiliaceae bacterium JC017]